MIRLASPTTLQFDTAAEALAFAQRLSEVAQHAMATASRMGRQSGLFVFPLEVPPDVMLGFADASTPRPDGKETP